MTLTTGALLSVENCETIKKHLKKVIAGPDILCNYAGKDSELRRHCSTLIFEVFQEVQSMKNKNEFPTFKNVIFRYKKIALSGDGAVNHLFAGVKGPGSTRRCSPNLSREEYLGHTWMQGSVFVFTIKECFDEKEKEIEKKNKLKAANQKTVFL